MEAVVEVAIDPEVQQKYGSKMDYVIASSDAQEIV